MPVEWWALGVSIIALLISFSKDFIIPAIFKPRIILEGKNDEECVDDALMDTFASRNIQQKLESQGLTAEDFPNKFKSLVSGHKKKSRWLRLRLKNGKGFFSRTAINCYVKLIEIRNSKNKCIRPFNAFPLMWVSYATPKSNLAKGEYHLLDLAFEKENERVIYPATHHHYGLPNALFERRNEKLSPDVYTFKLGVYGDNFNPIVKDIKVELTQQFGELKFVY